MLVVTRKAGEQIVIGDNITVTVLEIRGRQVKIGIQAPDSVRIVRAELLDRRPQGHGNLESDSAEDAADCSRLVWQHVMA